MKKSSFILRFSAVLLCFVLLLTLSPCAFAAPRNSVRVGFFAFDGYHMKDDSGKLSGYGYDIIQYLHGYTTLSFEFVDYEDSWSEAQEKLANGEIDMLTSAQKTEDRLDRFDFSDRPIGTSSAILSVKAGNTSYILDEYSSWSGMRIGMLDSNSRNQHLQDFATEHGFTYVPVFYSSTDELLAALDAGVEIDAVLTSNLRSTDNEWILAQFDPSPFYIMVKKGNTELLSEINSALGKLYTAMPDVDTMLMEKHYFSNQGFRFAFSVEERDIIEASSDSPITVGIISDSPPSCYYDAALGEYRGLSMDILKAVANKTGLCFEYVPIDISVQSPVAWLRTGSVQLAAGVLKTQTHLDDSSLVLSDELLADSMVMIGRKGDDFSSDPQSRTIVCPTGFQAGIEYINKRFPSHNLQTMASFEQCMTAVAEGKADATVYLRTSAGYALQNPHYERLEIVPIYGTDVSISVAGLSKDSAPIIELVNKGLAMLSESERSAIMLNYTILNPYQLTTSDVLYKYRISFIVITLLFLMVIAAGIGVFRVRSKTSKKLLEAYEQTKDALVMAEAASAAKSQFLSRVSHEMRTPLNAIIGFMELAKDAPAQELPSYVSNTNIAAKQLLSVINDVLDMSAIESGKMTLSQSSFDFKQLIHAANSVYRQQCQQKGLNFECHIHYPVDDWLIGDQLRVNQILFNLLNNAVKFTHEGSVSLSISQTELSDTEVVIRLQVSDTGCGISEEMQSRLFMPFEQESSNTAVRYGGSGLGLSIVKNLVSMMGGQISVNSAPDKGSVFTVDIPFLRKNEGKIVSLPSELQNLRILAVDDDELDCKHLHTILERMGLRHSCVSCGQEALEELSAAKQQNDPYIICLINWKKPITDGIETVRRIRERFGESIHIIVVSACKQHELDTALHEAKADLFVSKPLSYSALYDLFMTYINGQLSKKSPIEDSDNYDFNGKRVLLAEDNAMNRTVTQAILSKFGVSCEFAEDGELAVESFTGNPPGYYDAILMDIQMPKVDGFEATRRIRVSGHPNAESIPIIALTANAFNEDIVRSLSSGMNAHVSKPISPDALYKALQKAFFGI